MKHNAQLAAQHSLAPFVRMLYMTAMTVALMIGFAPRAGADVTYTYTGGQYDYFDGQALPCAPTCRITGSITYQVALPPNLPFPTCITPKSSSFSDGVIIRPVISPCFGTDANGNIVWWQIDSFRMGPSDDRPFLTYNFIINYFGGAQEHVSIDRSYCFGVVYCIGVGPNGSWSAGGVSEPPPPPPLNPPTNLRTTQLGSSGDQILLTWDYGNGPIDGFKIERKTPTQTWDQAQMVAQVGFAGPPYASVDSVPLSYATYVYRVRAYKRGGNDSSNSNESVGYQLLKRITDDSSGHHNARIEVSFEPEPGKHVIDVARSLHYDHFNWISMVVKTPTYYGSDSCYQANPMLDFDNRPQFAPFLDPPIGGYQPGVWMDKLPYYYNEVLFWYRNFFQPLESKYYLYNPQTGAGDQRSSSIIRFSDIPGTPCMNGTSDYESFVTSLEGIRTPFGAEGLLPDHDPLAAFLWSSSFNKTTGEAQFNINLDSPTGPGMGEVFNVESVRTEDFPPEVKQLLIQSGAQGLPVAPKLDKDAPMTASFLSGPQSGGWYTGTALVTLIATDIDGPSDIAGTSYSVDGGSTLPYTAPFGVFSDGNHTIQFSSVDKAGNAEVPHSVSFKIDQTPPTITGFRSPNPNGSDWNNSSVTISFQCSDALSGLAGNPPLPVTVSTQGAGQSVKGTCADVAGNSASLTVPGINIDLTPPTITVAPSAPMLWPPNGKLVADTFSGTVTDTLSGIDPSTLTFTVIDEYGQVQPTGTISVGSGGQYSFGLLLQASRLDVDLNGRHYQIIVTGRDKAGNQTSASTMVSVPHDQGQ